MGCNCKNQSRGFFDEDFFEDECFCENKPKGVFIDNDDLDEIICILKRERHKNECLCQRRRRRRL